MRSGGFDADDQDIAQARFRDDLRGATLATRIFTIPNREQHIGLAENDATGCQVRFRCAVAGTVLFEDRRGVLRVVEPAVEFLGGGVLFEIVEVLVAGEGQRTLQFIP
jgi:hypothetical protein